MGFYIRDSIRVGPFRFNLSKSGVGMSVGVRGFRVGTGPRGNYVHMGAHGLYYRATLPSGGAGRPQALPLAPGEGAPADDGLEEIDSGNVSAMRDSSSADLLREIDEKRRRARVAPVLALLGAAAAAGAAYLAPQMRAELPPDWPAWAPFVVPAAIAAASVVAFVYASRRDELARSVVLFYKLEGEAEHRYQQLHDAFAALARCGAAWHIEAASANTDWKRSGGATRTVRRTRVGLGLSAPPIIKTNIAVPALPCGRETLCFFPDRLLVFTGHGVGAVAYGDLSLERYAGRFIEDESVPGDAEVVDTTWQYVNRNGGPDRRFNNNRQLPVVLYETLHLRSGSGLNEQLQLSRHGVAEQFAAAAQQLGSPASSRGGHDESPGGDKRGADSVVETQLQRALELAKRLREIVDRAKAESTTTEGGATEQEVEKLGDLVAQTEGAARKVLAAARAARLPDEHESVCELRELLASVKRDVAELEEQRRRPDAL